ncbi:MAG: restriction endonuclease [Armatimonadetes bacterium]|nr:restriction endonuclease [Armatimonadota bacterium]
MEEMQIYRERVHAKASERYVDVTFLYSDAPDWDGSIPIEYRRTGISLTDATEIESYVLQCREHCHPANWTAWQAEQAAFWEAKPNAGTTRSFFDGLLSFTWRCVQCQLTSNPNWARRIQDIKECGYTIATHTNRLCNHCDKNTTHLLLVPLPRGGITGYEAWSPALRTRIINLLGRYDVYEGKAVNPHGLLPDHKFPEIRWDSSTRREFIDDLTDDEIRNDFQLMTNQRNQQKREVCRTCYQTKKRGYPFGVRFFYTGGEDWGEAIPDSGADALQGCVGCGWYDMATWRSVLNQNLSPSAAVEEDGAGV